MFRLHFIKKSLISNFNPNLTNIHFTKGYKWTIIIPKGSSIGNEFKIVRTGGGSVKLVGTNTSVISCIKQSGTSPLRGFFTLRLYNHNASIYKSSPPIPTNVSVQDLEQVIESVGIFNNISVTSESLDINNTNSGAIRYDITFNSLKDGGDLPLIELEENETKISGTDARILIKGN